MQIETKKDGFNKKLFQMAIDSPDLQQAIINGMSGGYSIPTGDITLINRSEKLTQAIQTAGELKVKDLARMLGELRVALTLEEVQGRTLTKQEKTLRDIDINALATWALVKWATRKKEGRT